jgi:hypothetical protein
MLTKANLKRQDRQDSGKTNVNSPIVFPIINTQNCTKTLSITRKTYNMFKLSIDVLWLKYLFFTNFRLSVYSLQRVDYNEGDARFTITDTVYTMT